MSNSFVAKDIKEKLKIPPDRWKRWAREFIGIDPKAARQGGVARTFTLDQVFHIYLCGWLVTDLQYSIPEARTIVIDLEPWLKERGLWPDSQSKTLGDAWDIVGECRITIHSTGEDVPFAYSAFGIIEQEDIVYKGYGAQKMIYVERFIPTDDEASKRIVESKKSRILYISDVKQIIEFQLGLYP